MPFFKWSNLVEPEQSCKYVLFFNGLDVECPLLGKMYHLKTKLVPYWFPHCIVTFVQSCALNTINLNSVDKTTYNKIQSCRCISGQIITGLVNFSDLCNDSFLLPTESFEGISFSGRKVSLFPSSRLHPLTVANRRAYVCLAVKQRLAEMTQARIGNNNCQHTYLMTPCMIHRGRGSTSCAVVNPLKNWLLVQRKKIFCFVSETTKPTVG